MGKVGVSISHLDCMQEIQTRIFEENVDGKCNIERHSSCLAIHVQSSKLFGFVWSPIFELEDHPYEQF